MTKEEKTALELMYGKSRMLEHRDLLRTIHVNCPECGRVFGVGHGDVMKGVSVCPMPRCATQFLLEAETVKVD